MTAIAQTLLQKLEDLPAQRLAEVADFVEFLTAREARSRAGAQLGESLSKLDTVDQPPLSDAEIEAEIDAARAQRRARPS